MRKETMPKVRDILVHVCVETAARRRKCYRNGKHSIAKGEQCLVVKTGSTNSKYNYCQQCAKDILDLAERRMAGIADAMGLRLDS